MLKQISAPKSQKFALQNTQRAAFRIFFNLSGFFKHTSFFKYLSFVLLSFFCTIGLQAHALDLFNKPKSQFLPVNEAFQAVPQQKGDVLEIDFSVTPKHYLYQQRMKLVLPTGVQITPQTYSVKPTFVNDPEFGRVPVFENNVKLSYALPAGLEAGEAKLKWQGCAKAGLCYPPITEMVSLQAISIKSAASKPANTTASKATDKNEAANKLGTKPTNQPKADTPNTEKTKAEKNNTVALSKDTTKQKPVDKKTKAADTNSVKPTQNWSKTAPLSESNISSKPLPPVQLEGATTVPPVDDGIKAGTSTDIATLDNTQIPTEVDGMSSSNTNLDNKLNTSPDPFGLANNKLLGVALLFLAGLGLAFTPCVLPMLPIVANIVASGEKRSAKQGFLLTLSYGVGVALAYGLLGAIVSALGQQYVVHAMQNKWVLIGFALLFVLLALYLLDVISLRMPAGVSQFLQRLSQRGQGGLGKASIFGSAVAGFFSAIVVSPCVTAPMVGALAGVASVGDPVFGFAALFFLGFGLSVPLILFGTFEAKILPEAGEWMNWVKHGFALLLFGVAILLLARVFDTSFTLVLWAALTAAITLWLWMWEGKGYRIFRLVAVGFGIWAVLQLIGAALGNTSPLRPLENLISNQATSQAPQKEKITIHTLAELETLKVQHKKLIVDVWADWCIECKIMDKNLFANPPIDMSSWQLVRLDISEANDETKKVIETLDIFGPPVLLFYKDGESVAVRHGETKRAEFEAILTELNSL